MDKVDESASIRERLRVAAEDLLNGRVPGPVTGIRLVEVAGVKRHRLTHDNPDINRMFQERARQLNRAEPVVTDLREKLRTQQERITRLVQEVEELRATVNAYATAIAVVTDERDRLSRALSRNEKLAPFSRPLGHGSSTR